MLISYLGLVLMALVILCFAVFLTAWGDAVSAALVILFADEDLIAMGIGAIENLDWPDIFTVPLHWLMQALYYFVPSDGIDISPLSIELNAEFLSSFSCYLRSKKKT